VVLKKVLKDNSGSFQKMKEGNLLPPQDAITALVLDQLENSNNGLITQKELQEALVKASSDKSLTVDNQSLV